MKRKKLSSYKKRRARRHDLRMKRSEERKSGNPSAISTDNPGLCTLIVGDDDIMLYTVLTYLKNAELARCSQVCKRFSKVAKQCMDPAADGGRAFLYACAYNSLPAVEFLLQDGRVDPSAFDSYVLRWACLNGHIEVVCHLLQDERIDPAIMDNKAIQIASENGHHELVRLLLRDSRVDPSARDNEAIRKASEKGHNEVARLLLQDSRVDPSAQNNAAIRQRAPVAITILSVC